jgi:hypothetical protein
MQEPHHNEPRTNTMGKKQRSNAKDVLDEGSKKEAAGRGSAKANQGSKPSRRLKKMHLDHPISTSK